MHLGPAKNFLLLFGTILFAFYTTTVSAAPENDSEVQEIIIEESPYGDIQENEDGKVVELLNPYAKRRSRFGGTISVNYSTYNPTNYIPNFVVNTDFESEYGASEVPFLSLLFSVKWNNALGSLGIEAGAGYYSNSGDNDAVVSMTPYMLGGIWTLDNLFKEPLVAPYVSGGVAYIEFTESLGTQSRGGRELHFYYSGGVLIQVDWLDSDGDYASYMSGIENTFINLGVMGILGGQSDDADFSGDIGITAGFKVEI